MAAIVSAFSAALVGIVALLVNSHRFGDLGKVIEAQRKLIDNVGRRIDDTNRGPRNLKPI